MKYRLLYAILVVFFFCRPIMAGQSTITEVDGAACMGDDKSRKQTEQAALTDAKKRAVEFASTYMKSATEVKDFVLEKDLLAAYAQAEVKIVQELEKARVSTHQKNGASRRTLLKREKSLDRHY